MAESVEDHFQFSTTKSDRLEWPEELRKVDQVDMGRGDNFARFPKGKVKSLQPVIKLIAAAYWLISDDNKLSTLTREELFANWSQPRIAEHLAKYLYQNTDELPSVTAGMLKGQYFYCTGQRRYTLDVEVGEHDNICLVNVLEERTIKCHRNDKRLIGAFRYEGWIVIAPNDSLFCLLKSNTEFFNDLLIPIATSALKPWSEEKVAHLVFMAIPVAQELTGDVLELDVPSMLTEWSHLNADNTYVFQRSKPSS